MIDAKTRTIRCTYYYSNEEDDRCLSEATHFFRITTPRKIVYDAKCDLHQKHPRVISGQRSDLVDEIDRETFIVEPVMES